MSDLTEIARAAMDIAEDAKGSCEDMSVEELATMLHGLGAASTRCTDFLVQRFRGDLERARVEIVRAMDLPARVLKRRAKEAEEIIKRDDLPDVPQHAALIAVMLREIQSISAGLERKQARAALN
ncbi:MAG: hypothetical protein R3C46_01265 [Hyphomonadaceae bacterium]